MGRNPGWSSSARKSSLKIRRKLSAAGRFHYKPHRRRKRRRKRR